MAPDSASLLKGVPVRPHVHGTLWAVGIKKDLATLGVQLGSQVTKEHPCVMEALMRCAGRQRHHNLQDMRACGNNTTLHSAALRG
jgi:hypothetical protein